MSLSAARAVRDIAECLDNEARACPHELARALLFALARAHENAADRIKKRAEREIGGTVAPAEFESGQAGTRKGGE